MIKDSHYHSVNQEEAIARRRAELMSEYAPETPRVRHNCCIDLVANTVVR